MAKPDMPSYANLALTEPTPHQAESPPVKPEPISDGTLKQVAAHVMLYISPEADKALAQYALTQSGHRRKVRKHDLIIEALEDWFAKHGLREVVRAKPK